MIKKTVCVIVFLVIIQNTPAQEVRDNRIENNFWFTLGTGYAVPVNSLPVLFTSFTYNYKNSLFSLRYIMNRELFGVFGDEPFEEVYDIGLLYGRMSHGKGISMSASGGISYIFGILRGDPLPSDNWFVSKYEKIEIATVGAPFELALMIAPAKAFGFGFNLFGNLNREQSYIGIGFNASVGDMLKLKKVFEPARARRDSLRTVRREAFAALPAEVQKNRKISRLIFGLGTLGFAGATLGLHLRAHSSEGAADDYREMRDGSYTPEEYDKYDKMYREEKDLVRALRAVGNTSAVFTAAGIVGFALSFRL